jgi:hypothetical protein
MAIALEWLDQHETILIWRFASHWTAEDFYKALDKNNKLIEQKAHPISVVIDMLDVKSFPTGVLTHAANGLATRRTQNVQTVVILKHPTLQILYNTFIRFHSRLNPHYVNHLHLVTTWTSANALLPDYLPTNHNTELSYP